MEGFVISHFVRSSAFYCVGDVIYNKNNYTEGFVSTHGLGPRWRGMVCSYASGVVAERASLGAIGPRRHWERCIEASGVLTGCCELVESLVRW